MEGWRHPPSARVALEEVLITNIQDLKAPGDGATLLISSRCLLLLFFSLL